MSTPIIGVYNDAHVAELYEAFRRDPSSVEESWRQYFQFALSLSGGGAVAAAPVVGSATTDAATLRKVAGAAALIDAIRHYGHLAVHVDPLGSAPSGAAELSAEFHGITEADLAQVPATALGHASGTAADVARTLRAIYAGRVGYEVGHLEEDNEREWFREAIEGGAYSAGLSTESKVALLERLTQVDGLERFIARAYPNVKRFSIEGTDAMVPMLDTAIDEAAKRGAQDVVIGMAHRGRLNVLVHMLDKPYEKLFNEFDGKHADHADSETGDVKYHLGAQTVRATSSGRDVRVALVPNPSHLEVVNPVLTGVARATIEAGTSGDAAVLAVVIHGDAAFPGEGVVAETFNMSRLPGYRVGGSLHIIANNQVGFTTNPSDARSTWYASDLAKGFEVPIVHVNADDAEACLSAVRLGIAYREKFGKDFLIDLVGYRRWGHNEGDEPTYTQPKLYATIRQHPTLRQIWGKALVDGGIMPQERVDAIDAAFQKKMDDALTSSREHDVHADDDELEIEVRKGTPSSMPAIETAVRAESLVALNEQLLAWPASHTPHPRLAKQLERRREAMGEAGGIDWGHAEALAFASLLTEGVNVRLTGQDAERGTFSHRHAVLNDVNTGAKYTPLQHLPNVSARFDVHNSPLTELAVLGFEYGYSVQARDALVLWEAQFGDFANMAAPIIDQFIAADRAKWSQDSSVVMLLPHGYEGQGPEHSSARLERFLQLCAEGNLRVAYPTSPAQYFHILRRQAHLPVKRPLVLMQPKSMLRLPVATSTLEQLTAGRFMPVLDDPFVRNRDEVTRLVFCTGKIYYDLTGKDHPGHLAVVRVEQLYPWPHEEVSRIVDLYPNIAEIVWAQEEPKNMGAWSYVAPRLRASAGNALIIRYIGRPERASPAEGYASSHQVEQARIVGDVHAAPIVPRGRPPAMR
ncbi:MAG: 2-oxoglutarate dehydrogenase E1 component [Gemmatimonadaceae bacterium]|nr:2-oxoglutarate dehydrogenase E1 component [Gemmatimonadaceae bacterium]